MRLGVFGGSFDPPHVGHVTVSAMALSLSGLDELLVVPCYEHALGKTMSPFDHRVAMCELAFSQIRHTRVTDLERALGGTSYTLRTLEHLAASHPDADLCLLVGADAMAERESWHRFEEIERTAEVIVFGRQGVDLDVPTLPAPPGVSATDIRERLARGGDASGLVPRSVLRYIVDHDLYR